MKKILISIFIFSFIFTPQILLAGEESTLQKLQNFAEENTENQLKDAQTNLQKSIEGSNLQVELPGFNLEEAAKTIYLEEKPDGSVLSHTPLINLYIASLFRYSMYALIIISILFIIIAGFEWTISGGNKVRIDSARNRIYRSIAGLLIGLLSYTILNAINPKLINLQSLGITTVLSKNQALRSNVIGVDYHNKIKAYLDNIKKPTWTPQTFDCNNPPPEQGVTPKDQLVTASCPVGVSGTFTVIPEMKDAICRAGELADSKGYVIKIFSSYRSYDRQVSIWCNSKEPIATRRSIIALPGFSNHGNGLAIDVALRKKGENTNLTGAISASRQCGVPEKYIKIMAEIFYNADFNFSRLESEIWHFEYGTKKLIPLRDWYNGYPKRCTGKESPVSNINIQNPITQGESPAAQANKCSFTESRWHKANGRSEVFRTEKNAPYSQIVTENPTYVSKIDPRCSICEEDQVNVTVAGKTIKVCWVYAEEVKQILSKAINSGFEITQLIGYRPLRSGGAVDSQGYYNGVGGHFYGMAVDVNRNHNGLYNGCSGWDAAAATKGPLPNACKLRIGGEWDPNSKPNKSIYYGSPIYNAFKEKGWKWGGIDFGNGRQRDFMDFTIYGYDFST